MAWDQYFSKRAAGTAAAEGADAGDVVTSGLISSGDPYALGAGLALKTLGSINKKKEQQAMNEYKAEVARQEARQKAAGNMASIASGLRL